MGCLKLQNLSITYTAKPVITDFSLNIADGEIVSLLGPSGAGKTTILKAIAGLLRQDSGSILINGQPVDHLPAERRDAVLIFQKPLLFPFLNVSENIGFGLRMAGMTGKKARQKIADILAITGLEGLQSRKIHQLSGGQQQRVALARGLVLEPSVLLLDEPLSSLDAELRQQMRELIRTVQAATKTTMLFVTHDQSEAFSISDRICLLLGGSLRQTGTPAELFYHPADADVARFFGCSNFLSTAICQKLLAGSLGKSHLQNEDITAVIRPEDIVLSNEANGSHLAGKIMQIQFEGSMTRLTIRIGGDTYTALSLRPSFQVGQQVWLDFPAERLHFLHNQREKI